MKPVQFFSEWQGGFSRIKHETLWTYSCQIWVGRHEHP